MTYPDTPPIQPDPLLIRALTAERNLAERDAQLAAMAEHEAAALESDSIVASCNCGAKSPAIEHHKPGCKYRLIVERDQARGQLAEARTALELAAQYMRHDKMCGSARHSKHSCDCGLPEAFKGVKQALARIDANVPDVERREPVPLPSDG